jgi:hydroxyethylthiazole kinase-like uncharacterized protein yjeF
MNTFQTLDLKKLFTPDKNSNKNDNGRVTIIGGSNLFHGAPLLALTTASRFVDMVFFASPEPSVGKVAENLKSKLLSFIWVPIEEVEEYLAKSDSALIGPGLMRYRSEKVNPASADHCDEACQETKNLTKNLLTSFPNLNWVIDAGSLQVLDPAWIPSNAILTPNKKEYQMLFGEEDHKKVSQKYHCHLIHKSSESIVYSPNQTTVIKGGNAGLTKGGTGDVLAGLTAAFYAKNEAHLAAAAASHVLKSAADDLYKTVNTNYNSDDLATQIPVTLNNLLNY